MSVTLYTVNRRIYESLQKQLTPLLAEYRESLENLGVGRSSYELFARLSEVLTRLARGSFEGTALESLAIRGVLNPRRELIVELFLAIGVELDTSTRYADALLEHESRHPRSRLNDWLLYVFQAAKFRYKLVLELQREVGREFEGSYAEPTLGTAQIVRLLQRVPDLADRVYAGAGLSGLSGFPPDAKADSEPQRLFVEAVGDYLEDETSNSLIRTVAIAILSIAATLLTGGRMGPAAAAWMGAGLATIHGGVLVGDAAGAVARGRVAVAIGAMKPETLQRLERELDGAWTNLVVDLATLGLLGRFGGSKLATIAFRSTVISGAGGGLKRALEPGIWDDPDAVMLVLEATVITGAVGAGGALVAGGVARLVTGQRVQVGVERSRGPVAAGRSVRLSAGKDGDTIPAKIERVDGDGGTVTLSTADGSVRVRVTQTRQLSSPGARRWLNSGDYASSDRWLAAVAAADKATRALDKSLNPHQLKMIYEGLVHRARIWGLKVKEVPAIHGDSAVARYHFGDVRLGGPLDARRLPSGGRAAALRDYRRSIIDDYVEVQVGGRVGAEQVNSLLHEMYHAAQARMYGPAFWRLVESNLEHVEVMTEKWVGIQLRRLAKGQALLEPTRGF